MSFLRDAKNKIYSGDNIVSLSDIRYLPRWVILIIDLVIVFFAAVFSNLITKRIGHQTVFYDNFLVFTLILSVSLFFMFVFKTYSGIIRHSTFIDLFKLIISTFCSVIALGVFQGIFYSILDVEIIFTPFAFLSIYGALAIIFLFLFRLTVKEFFYFAREFRRSGLKKRVLVLGIGEQSIAIARAIIDNPAMPYSVEGFITQRKDYNRAKILGRKIYFKKNIEKKSKENLGVEGVIIIKETVSRDEMIHWVNLFLEKGIQVFKAPSVQKLRDHEVANSIRNLQIEDLLNRKPIIINNTEVSKTHFNKNILVTGGAGSIGSEIVRQVAKFKPALIVVLDQAETPLHDIERELKSTLPHVRMRFVLADITNAKRMESLFKKMHFSMVYHAAAYKHVPTVEDNPHEGVFVNVCGTKNLATLASRYKVDRFVMISTDKAVNPSNVMGASKRVAELFVQALQKEEGNHTKFITTRFGNVLGSNGSVIPYFKKQIDGGGPVTITHPEIVRYFMIIPEACELVLEAGTMGKGGEIYVFDMGEPVKIIDLAKRMIRLSGFEPEVDIKIVYTGLRPGEKLYEELLSDNSKTVPTHNDKILISRDQAMEYKKIKRYVDFLTRAVLEEECNEVVKILKMIVPEYKSRNSSFEMLDREID
ncbi:MAG: polysaccharide biosynthesis protein [Bergeyella sp.]|nr:polysaccharide biosynthesis protein [Bergeyella sp.]